MQKRKNMRHWGSFILEQAVLKLKFIGPSIPTAGFSNLNMLKKVHIVIGRAEGHLN